MFIPPPLSIKPFYKRIVIKEGLRFAFKYVFKEGRVFSNKASLLFQETMRNAIFNL